MIVKGTRVRFELAEWAPGAKQVRAAAGALRENPMRLTTGIILILPASYAMMHDQEGKNHPRCDVFFGPIRKSSERAPMGRAASRYFGSDYDARRGDVDVPTGPWKRVGVAIQIFYKREGRARGLYYHPFKAGHSPLLEKCGRFYRLTMPRGCVYDDRGYVFP